MQNTGQNTVKITVQNGVNIKQHATAVFMVLTTVLWLTLEAWLWGLIPALIFVALLFTETKERRRLYLALSSGIACIIAAPLKTDITVANYSLLAPFYLLSLILPRLVLWNYDRTILKIRVLPEKWRRSDFIFITFTMSLSIIGLFWYLTYANPEVLLNWQINTATPVWSLFMLAFGMYAVGFWDEAFGQNTALAIYEKLFSAPFAIALSSTIYAAALWDLAFRGWGFFVMYFFVFSQGVLWYRTRCLFWVVLVHFSLELFLYILIVRTHF